MGESVITERDLMYQTFPQETAPGQLVYTLISPPQQGDLFITSNSGKSGSRLRRLEAHSNFTQVEILSGRLKYKLIGKVTKASSKITISMNYDCSQERKNGMYKREKNQEQGKST